MDACEAGGGSWISAANPTRIELAQTEQDYIAEIDGEQVECVLKIKQLVKSTDIRFPVGRDGTVGEIYRFVQSAGNTYVDVQYIIGQIKSLRMTLLLNIKPLNHIKKETKTDDN